MEGKKQEKESQNRVPNMSKAQITIPLDIPDVRVLQTSVNERGEIIITIESTKVGTTCRKCGKWITKLHGQDEWVMIRHLPAFGRPSYLRYRPRRYQCQDCEGHPTTTQSLGWHDANSPHSFAYDNHVLLQLVHSTVEDVRVKEGLAYESVAGALERRIEARVDWTEMADIERLGLDEIALKKGQGNYVTLVTGQFREGEIVILGVLPGHEKAVVVDFLRSIPQSGSCKVCRRSAVICGRLTPKPFGRKSPAHGSSLTVFMWPGIIGKLPTICANRNYIV